MQIEVTDQESRFMMSLLITPEDKLRFSLINKLKAELDRQTAKSVKPIVDEIPPEPATTSE
jgi:hypothetical protein